jgi:hypothetical protein
MNVELDEIGGSVEDEGKRGRVGLKKVDRSVDPQVRDGGKKPEVLGKPLPRMAANHNAYLRQGWQADFHEIHARERVDSQERQGMKVRQRRLAGAFDGIYVSPHPTLGFTVFKARFL